MADGSFAYLSPRNEANALNGEGITAIMVTHLDAAPSVINDTIDRFGGLILVGAVSIYYKNGHKTIKKKNLNQDRVDLSF